MSRTLVRIVLLVGMATTLVMANLPARQQLDADDVALLQVRTDQTHGRAQQAVRLAPQSRSQTPMMKKAVVTAANPELFNFVKNMLHPSPQNCDLHFERIQIVDVPVPSPTMSQALVKVLASSANPHDYRIFGTATAGSGVGEDFAGSVVSVGQFCSGFSPGDVVWGVGDGNEGQWQEFVVHECSHLGKAPVKFSILQAGAAPIVTLTALEALRGAGAPWSESQKPTVLVIGGSSGTGHVGIQMAKAFGAGKVITTCSPQNFDFVRGLGADVVLDYHTQNWWEVLPYGSVDFVYDCIVATTDSGDKAYKVLADGGHYAGLLPGFCPSAETMASRPSISTKCFMLDDLRTYKYDMVKDLVDDGKLTVTIDRVFHGLDSVVDLLNASFQGHAVGKLALDLQ